MRLFTNTPTNQILALFLRQVVGKQAEVWLHRKPAHRGVRDQTHGGRVYRGGGRAGVCHSFLPLQEMVRGGQDQGKERRVRYRIGGDLVYYGQDNEQGRHSQRRQSLAHPVSDPHYRGDGGVCLLHVSRQ